MHVENPSEFAFVKLPLYRMAGPISWAWAQTSCASEVSGSGAAHGFVSMPAPWSDTSVVGSSESFEATRSVAVLAPTVVGSNSIVTTRFELGPSTAWPLSLRMRNWSASGPASVTLERVRAFSEPRLVMVMVRGAAGPSARSRLPKATTGGATLISGPGTGKFTVCPEVFSGDGEPRTKSSLRLVESPKLKFWNRASEVGCPETGSAGAGGPAPSVRPAGKAPYERQRLTVKPARLSGLPRKQ